jgi:type II secretory pathway pseudopilin PulG
MKTTIRSQPSREKSPKYMGFTLIEMLVDFAIPAGTPRF